MSTKTKAEYKIIADHLRSSCFLIADGVLPSNEGRGYVLRRIMRRAMRQLHKLGAREAMMYKFVDALIDEMHEAYGELDRARGVLVETLKNEEEKFRETLDKGLKILEEEISRIASSSQLSGAVAFKLYDTYGFPLDLTEDILREKNLTVDIAGFNHEMEMQRQRAKSSWKGSGEEKEDSQFLELRNKFGATKFIGYDDIFHDKATIIALSDSAFSDLNWIILDETPFYATSGGQKGDEGTIILASDGDKSAKIIETKKFGGDFFVHFLNGQDVNHKFKIGDKIIAQVNPKTRQARARSHSGTHLMHKALKEVLGNVISQKGSNVDSDYFTFDFNFNRAMTSDEKARVEKLVNNYIAQNSTVKTEIMPLERARQSGAEALFGEKYDNDVRVVSMSPSVELCGGTHVKNTGDVEIFKIISENGIAAGIRRITAITGFMAVAEYNKNEAEKTLEETRRLEQKQKEKDAEKLRKQNILANLDSLESQIVEGEIKLLHHLFVDLEAKDLREITNDIKNRKQFNQSHIFALFATKDDKISVCVAISNNLLDKFDATKLINLVVETIGGKGGGGKKDLAMGGGVNKETIATAVDLLKNTIKSAL